MYSLPEIYSDIKHWLLYKVFQVKSTYKYSLLGWNIIPGNVVGGEKLLVEYLKDLAKDIREICPSDLQASQIERWIRLYEFSLTNFYEKEVSKYIIDKYGERNLKFNSPYYTLVWEKDYTETQLELIYLEEKNLKEEAYAKQKKLENLVWKLYSKYRNRWWD